MHLLAYHAPMDLYDRHVVVTGAAGGIGAALSRAFAARGARVSATDITPPSLDEMPNAIALASDLSSEAGNRALIDEARSQHGPIDLFFANAGVALGIDPLDDEELWDASFNVNIHAHRWAARYLLPEWLERGEGYFASTASAAGLLAQIGSAPYSVTKHAAVAFAEWMSITYGARGINVTCLCPQGVNTNMLNASEVLGDGGEVVRSVGEVLEPSVVADRVIEAVEAERFFVLPHAEVADYMVFRATDTEKWIAGMQRLQRRIMGV